MPDLSGSLQSLLDIFAEVLVSNSLTLGFVLSLGILVGVSLPNNLFLSDGSPKEKYPETLCFKKKKKKI